jgi:hypothetical protein
MSQWQMKIESEQGLIPKLLQLGEVISKGLKAGAVVITLGREERSAAQNLKYHAMIGDISKQVTLFGNQYSDISWKAKLVDGYEQELKSQGKSLRKPSHTTISLDGQRAVSIRASTKDFDKKEAAGFVEYIYMIGSEFKVQWSEPAMNAYQEYRQAA